MPTPSKLVAAVLFAALAWLVGDLIVRMVLEEGVRVGRFREILALGGLLVGWRYVGRETTGRTGKGTTMARGITAGIAGALILMMLALLLHSLGVMVLNSLDRKYNAIGQAGSAWMEFLWNDLQLVAHPAILIVLFGGGAVVGLVAGITGRVTR
ncbi:TrgA family protein [Jannaschia rubra]|uniref:Uncharacterized protein n=1 Tax=Jannaschia rubra TaxID=282197 RepID=A0A0M6XPZ5_9RHOB|nr:TrgA family protein [Jannaschia rubra]CTQ32968.1 hypothetical protein JAN5088_01743 [Jannaschia rubra]SFG59907.1 hypothetical protein SAMN04488517_10786 [Jannaschia rubra]